MFELDDIVVEYQPDRGGIVVANVEAQLSHQEQHYQQYQGNHGGHSPNHGAQSPNHGGGGHTPNHGSHTPNHGGHQGNHVKGHQSFTEADVSSGDAIRTKIQRGGSYMNESNRQQFQQDQEQQPMPNGNIERVRSEVHQESPRKRLERLLRTPTMDLSTSREIEVANSLPLRSRSMSPHDVLQDSQVSTL